MICVAGCASKNREPLAPVKNGKPFVSLPDSCEKKIPGTIPKGKLAIGQNLKTVAARRGSIIDKLNARIEARDKCASTRQNAFAGVP